MTDGIRCVSCAVERMAENTRQMRARQGPFYDRYLAGLAMYIMREFEAKQDPDLTGEEPYVEY